MRGQNILFVGGGIGMAPLRTLLLFMLDNRADYGDITLLYGARGRRIWPSARNYRSGCRVRT
jgi:NAD(P)H-flavin reductase